MHFYILDFSEDKKVMDISANSVELAIRELHNLKIIKYARRKNIEWNTTVDNYDAALMDSESDVPVAFLKYWRKENV